MNSNLKNIGILTFHHSSHNFGAVLQTYASFVVLKNFGYSPKVLNLLPSKDSSFLNNFKILIASFINSSRNFDSFRRKNLELTKRLYSFEDCKAQNKDFYLFYVGSDQVWRPVMAQERLYRYFLDFVDEDKIKISYAASFGAGFWEGSKEQTSMVSKLISQFDAISVREASGVAICKDFFNASATHVLDPTLLLDQEDYNGLLLDQKRTGCMPEDFVAYYLLSDFKGNGAFPKLFN